MKVSFSGVSFNPRKPEKKNKPEEKKLMSQNVNKQLSKAKTGAIIGLFLLPTLGVVKHCSTANNDPNNIVIVDEPSDTTERENYIEKSDASFYVVKSGDTPAGIAKKHGISTRRLLAQNGMDSKSVIYPKDTLLIPPSYTAQNIETLGDVAKMSGMGTEYLDALIGFEQLHNSVYKEIARMMTVRTIRRIV